MEISHLLCFVLTPNCPGNTEGEVNFTRKTNLTEQLKCLTLCRNKLISLSSVIGPDMGSHVAKGRQGDNCSLGRSWDPWRRPLAQPDVPVCSHTKLSLLDRPVGGN